MRKSSRLFVTRRANRRYGRPNSSAVRCAMLTASAAAASFMWSAHAQAQTWTFAGAGNWSTASNWNGGAPASGITTAVGFAAVGYNANQNIANPFTLNVMNLASGNGSVGGSALTFGGVLPAINQLGSGAVAVSNPITITSTGLNTDALTYGGTGSGGTTLSGALTSSIAPTATGGASVLANDANSVLSLSGGGTLYALRANAGGLAVTGGTWTLTSTDRENDTVGGINAGRWGLSIGETAGQLATFAMSGGTITGQMGFLATANNAIGAATFSNGAVANFNNSNGRFGVNAGTGTINILSGAQLSCRLLELGRQEISGGDPATGVQATLNIDGTGSRIDCSQQLVATRNTGNATISISNGGVLSVVGNAFNGSASGPLGDPLPGNVTVNVSGTGSSYLCTGQQTIGTGQNATVTLGTGGLFTGNNIFIGNGGVVDGGIGTVILNGGSVTNTAQFDVESAAGPSLVRINSGTWTMNGAGGGTFVNAFTCTTALDKAAIEINGSNSAFVQTGAATFLAVSTGNSATPGQGGISTITISGGGLMQIGSGFADVSAGTNTTAVLTVTGAGSRMVIGDAGVGSGDFIVSDDINTGTIAILNGGTASNGRSMFVATSQGGVGTLNIDGANSRLDVGRALVASGGGVDPTFGDPLPGGTANIGLSNGGVLNAQNGFIAPNPSSVATVNISGANSLMNIDAAGAGTSNLVVGDDNGAVGTVNVSASGRVNVVGNTFVSSTPGATGVLNVNGGSMTSTGQLQVGNNGGTFGGVGTVTVSNSGSAALAGLTIVGPTAGLAVTSNGRMSTSALISITGGQVNINTGGQISINSNGTVASNVDTLTISSGTLDLNNNDLIVNTTPKATIENLVRTARNNGAWNGAGINSSAARNNAAHNTTLGVLSGSEYISASGTTTFSGDTVSASDTLVKYTWYGDANFDGRVTFDDYTKIDTGFNQHLTGWFNGDFNLDGVVNFDDYVLIDTAFQTQSGTLGRALRLMQGTGSWEDIVTSVNKDPSMQLIGTHMALLGKAYAEGFIERGSALMASVPEPTTLSVMGLSAMSLLGRRRRVTR